MMASWQNGSIKVSLVHFCSMVQNYSRRTTLTLKSISTVLRNFYFITSINIALLLLDLKEPSFFKPKAKFGAYTNRSSTLL